MVDLKKPLKTLNGWDAQLLYQGLQYPEPLWSDFTRAYILTSPTGAKCIRIYREDGSHNNLREWDLVNPAFEAVQYVCLGKNGEIISSLYSSEEKIRAGFPTTLASGGRVMKILVKEIE